MANTTVNLTPDTWTQLTDADTSDVTFENVGQYDVYVVGTAGAVAPTSLDGALRYPPTKGEIKRALSDMWLGGSGLNRLYAYSKNGGSVMISHG